MIVSSRPIPKISKTSKQASNTTTPKTKDLKSLNARVPQSSHELSTSPLPPRARQPDHSHPRSQRPSILTHPPTPSPFIPADLNPIHSPIPQPDPLPSSRPIHNTNLKRTHLPPKDPYLPQCGTAGQCAIFHAIRFFQPRFMHACMYARLFSADDWGHI